MRGVFIAWRYIKKGRRQKEECRNGKEENEAGLKTHVSSYVFSYGRLPRDGDEG